MARATRYVLMVLAAEKVVQHAVVSWALASDQFGLRSEVTVDYRWLAAIGALDTVLFAAALIGLADSQRWSLVLLAILATSDILGEFVAQGTLAVSITVSLVVAVVVLALSLREVRRVPPVPASG